MVCTEPRCEKKRLFAAKLINAFVFATRIVQSLYLLNPKFQASNQLLWVYSPVCVGPGQKPRRPVFSQRGSTKVWYESKSVIAGEFKYSDFFPANYLRTLISLISFHLNDFAAAYYHKFPTL